MSPANPGTHPDTGPVARGITMMWYRDNMSGVEWTLMTLGMIAFWGVLALGIVLLVRSVRGTPGA